MSGKRETGNGKRGTGTGMDMAGAGLTRPSLFPLPASRPWNETTP